MTNLVIISQNYWLLSLALFLGLWGCAWSLNVGRKRKKENGDITPIITMKDTTKQKLRTLMENTGKVGLGIVLGVALGVGIRDHQLINQSHTYWDVAILEKYSNISFRIQPARMQDGQWDFCEPVPFQKYDKLRYITFEQKNGCKRLEYFQKLNPRLGEKLNATISSR